jgi:hypothetical protein
LQALLRQDDVDEAWTWQTRLWGDLVTMAVLTALLSTCVPLALVPCIFARNRIADAGWR